MNSVSIVPSWQELYASLEYKNIKWAYEYGGIST